MFQVRKDWNQSFDEKSIWRHQYKTDDQYENQVSKNLFTTFLN